MAADEQGNDGLQPHPLIDNLMNQASKAGMPLPEGAELPNVQVLTGYLARDTQPGYWRIYVDLKLNTFLSVAESDILGSQQLATEENPLRPTIVWVRQGAPVQYTRIDSTPVQAASFLQGEMMSRFMRGRTGSRRESRMAGLRARGGRNVRGAGFEASVDWCESVDFCRTPDYGACFSRPAWCRSEFNQCPSDFCQTDFACPTDVFCETYDYQLC